MSDRRHDAGEVATHCPYCALQCATLLRRDGDGAPAVRPHPDFPVNQGSLCQKGWTAPELLNVADRLRHPWVRDGKAEPRPASWDQALDRVATTLRALRADHGPDAVAVLGGGGLTNEKAYLLGKFARVALGTSRIDYNGRFCMSSAAAASIGAFGVDRGLPFPVTDLGHADVVLLAGANPAETMPPLMRHLERPELIVVDPRRTPTARRAAVHLQPAPGTDLPLALGLLHLAVTEGHADLAYIAARTTGFAAAREAAAAWTPERVAEVTGVPEAVLRQAVALLAGARRGYVLTGRGSEQHRDGTDTVSAFINLALALGLPGTEGNGFGCLTGQGNGQGGREMGQKADQLPGYRSITDPQARRHLASVWRTEAERLPGPGPSAYELLDSIGTTDGPRALLVFGTNPVVSAPNAAHIAARLAALDLLVVADFVPSETAQLADVVLPVTQWAEEEGTLTGLDGRVLRRRRLLDPPSGVRSDLDVLHGLAVRLDAPGEDYPCSPRAVFDELRRASRGGTADYAGISYDRLDAGRTLHWPCPEDGHPGTPRMFLDGFAHPDGKARFTPVVPGPPGEEPSPGYPLRATTGRVLAHYQSGAQTRRVRPLREAAPEPFVELHPDTAARLGVRDGETAKVTSPRGSMLARARLVADLRPDTVFAPFHYAGDGRANLLTGAALDPRSRMPEFKLSAVRVEPWVREDGRPAAAPRAEVPVCLCNNVSRRQLEEAWHAGARGFADLASATRATTGCGGCEPDVRDIIGQLDGSAPPPEPAAPAAVPFHGPAERPGTLIVVGHGMAGQRLVATLRSRDRPGRWRIVVLAEEGRPAYDRVSLSSYLDGKSADDLSLVGADLLADPLVELRLGCPAVAVDPAARTVRTAAGEVLAYDALVLATGSRPFVPPVPGRDSAGCFVYRTFEDLDAIRAAAAVDRPCVVIGGGVLGLEAASALQGLGMRPHVVERAPRILPAQLDEDESQDMARKLADVGLRLHCGTGATRLTARPDGGVRSVVLDDGSVLEADLVVFSAGVVPADDLAGQAGLARGERGGFLVDRHCRTADPHIWAVGECAAVAGRCYGVVAPGYRMADMVARHLLGEPAPAFTAPDTPTRLKLVGAAGAAMA